MKSFFSFLFVPLYLCTFARQAEAHAFGQQYTLPLPAWLYIYGGALTVFLSFVLAGIFIHPQKHIGDKKRLSLPIGERLPMWILLPLQCMSVFFLLLAILSGFIGVDIGVLNFNMTYFWIFLVIGGVYLSAIIGNWWESLNPWKLILDAGEYLVKDSLTGIFPYPRKLSYLPSVLFAFLLMVFELIFQTTPFTLSLLLFAYTTLTLSGMIVFGKEDWSRYGEIFTVYFGLIAKLCPFRIENGSLSFRLPGFEILQKPLASSLLLWFLIILLAGTAFDGYKESASWFRFYYTFLHNFEFLFPVSTYQGVEILFYICLILSFGGIYFLAMLLTSKILSITSVKQVANHYTGTLIPILLGYNIAHYLSLILTQGQAIISLLSDPFGFGWNILGTAQFKPVISLINLTTIWHIQVAAIILGHILAVILSHLLEVKRGISRRQLLLSQIPLLLLMIFYTMGGLWLLSLPLN